MSSTNAANVIIRQKKGEVSKNIKNQFMSVQSSPAVEMHKEADILSDILDFLSFAAIYTARDTQSLNMEQ